jgi:hypothetical protein
MLTPQEYTKYNAFKAIAEFGREMTVNELRHARKMKLKWVKDIVKDFRSVCDFGAGSEWLREICDELGIDYIAVDEIDKKGSFAKIDPVDLVVSITVLEHQTPQEVVDFIEIARQKSNYLFIATNNPKCIFSHYVLWDDITHVRMYSEYSIAALLQCKGFEIEKLFYQDSVLRFRSWLHKWIYNFLTKALGMMFLSNPYNYWCILARSDIKGTGKSS